MSVLIIPAWAPYLQETNSILPQNLEWNWSCSKILYSKTRHCHIFPPYIIDKVNNSEAKEKENQDDIWIFAEFELHSCSSWSLILNALWDTQHKTFSMSPLFLLIYVSWVWGIIDQNTHESPHKKQVHLSHSCPSASPCSVISCPAQCGLQTYSLEVVVVILKWLIAIKWINPQTEELAQGMVDMPILSPSSVERDLQTKVFILRLHFFSGFPISFQVS